MDVEEVDSDVESVLIVAVVVLASVGAIEVMVVAERVVGLVVESAVDQFSAVTETLVKVVIVVAVVLDPVLVLVVAADVVVGIVDHVSLVLEVVVVFGSEVVGDHVTVVVEVAVVVGTGVVDIAVVGGIVDHVLLVGEVSREVAVGVDHVSEVVETVVVVITGVVVESRVVSLAVEAVVLRDVIGVVVVVGGSAVEVKLIISAIIKRRIHKSTNNFKK